MRLCLDSLSLEFVYLWNLFLIFRTQWETFIYSCALILLLQLGLMILWDFLFKTPMYLHHYTQIQITLNNPKLYNVEGE